MSNLRPGNTEYEEGHFPEPAAVLGIAVELRGCEAAVPYFFIFLSSSFRKYRYHFTKFL